MEYNGTSGVDEELPGTVLEDLKALKMPYGIYVNPYTGYIYATDAGDYVAAGTLLQWTPEGRYVGKSIPRTSWPSLPTDTSMALRTSPPGQ